MNRIKLILIFLLVLPLIACFNSKQTMFLGIFPFFANEYQNCVDFSFERIESKTMLKLIDDNAYSFERKKDINSLIKKSDTLILSIGMFDLLKGVYYDDGEQKYQYIPSLLELFELNLYHIINSLIEVNKKISLCVLSLYNPYVFADSSFYQDISLSVEKYNHVIEYICNDFNLKFIDINEFSSFVEFNILSNKSKEQIMELIRENAR